MKELIFIVEDLLERGYIAKSLGESIFTEAEKLEDLKIAIKDAVKCHFDEESLPHIIRLHFVREEVITI